MHEQTRVRLPFIPPRYLEIPGAPFLLATLRGVVLMEIFANSAAALHIKSFRAKLLVQTVTRFEFEG